MVAGPPGRDAVRATRPSGYGYGVALFVGTSGWQYADWRDAFYPHGLPQRAWLAHYARDFSTVEVNNAFYRLPERSVFERWRQQTPEGFVVAVKVSRYLTHVRRLQDPLEPVGRLVDRAAGLGDRLGPYLLQLPPTLRAEPERLDACLAAFPTDARVAVEPRHESWWTDEVRTVLERRGAALCWSDRRGRPVVPAVAHGSVGLRPPARGHGLAAADLRAHGARVVARPHRRRVAGGRSSGRVRLLQQRSRCGRRPQRPHAVAHGAQRSAERRSPRPQRPAA